MYTVLTVYMYVLFADVPGTDYRIATISGTPDGCQRAKKWVEDLVAEVSFILTLSQPFHNTLNVFFSLGISVRTVVSVRDWSCPTPRVLEYRPFSLQCPATSVVSSSGKVKTGGHSRSLFLYSHYHSLYVCSCAWQELLNWSCGVNWVDTH